MSDYKVELENRKKVIWQFNTFNKIAEGNFHCTSYVSDSLKDTGRYEIQVFALKESKFYISVYIYVYSAKTVQLHGISKEESSGLRVSIRRY